MAQKKHILALDQGTTSCRSIIFDEHGKIASVDQREFTQIFPKPGWVEHDANEILRVQLATARGALGKANLAATDLAGIGITNQRETTLLWDRSTGRPVSNAIVWQDRRTASYCNELKSNGHADVIRGKTGLIVDAYFSGSKIRWILDSIPGLREIAESGEIAFGTIDSWLVWNMTGGKLHVTDATNASRTLLYNIHEGRWDPEMLALFEVPEAILPKVVASIGICGETEPTLLGSPVPIAGIAGDQQAALFGQACHKPGMAKNTYGTGCFLLLNTGETAVRSDNNLLTTIAWKIGDKVEYALEGSVFIGGAVVQWLRDQLGFFKSAEEIEALAAEVDDNGGVYLVPAFAGLGAPYWDSSARGVITGLTRGASRAHIARAALESIAYQSRDLLKAMEADAGISLSEWRADGGASLNNLLMQFQADTLGVPVVRPVVAETTALGAAYLAGIATGVWQDTKSVGEQWAVDTRFEPQRDPAKIEELLVGWRKAVEASRVSGLDDEKP